MDERSLIEAIRNGQDLAIAHVYRKHFPMIRSLVDKYGLNSEIEDIYQEAFMVMLNKLYDQDLTCKISTYLYACARNLTLKKMRDERKMHPVEEIDVREDVDDYEETDERLTALKRAMKQLGEKCQEILDRFYNRGEVMEEIAEAMGYTNAANVKNQKYKCVKQLKKLIVG